MHRRKAMREVNIWNAGCSGCLCFWLCLAPARNWRINMPHDAPKPCFNNAHGACLTSKQSSQKAQRNCQSLIGISSEHLAYCLALRRPACLTMKRAIVRGASRSNGAGNCFPARAAAILICGADNGSSERGHKESMWRWLLSYQRHSFVNC